MNDNSRLKRVKKSDLKCFVSYKCLKICATNSWYFDNVCYRHMTRNRDLLVNYRALYEGSVTFGDGVTVRILCKKTLNVDGFPWFKNVLHVDGLKANF